MKNPVSITVKKPCSEKFSNFSKTNEGGYCASCEKEVIDFTKMSQTAIIEFLCTNSTNTCGKFKTSQLGEITQQQNYTIMTNMLSKGIGALSFSLLSLCAVPTIEAQEVASNFTTQTEISSIPSTHTKSTTQQKNYKVRGTVLDEDNLPLPGVSIVLKGTKEGVSTDMDGEFEFPKSLEANTVLVFSYIGYDTKEYKIKANSTEDLDITITFDSSDIELMGEVAIEGVYKSKKNIFQKIGSIFN